MSVDLAEPITRAPYSYAKDNPVNFSDPSGLSVIGELESLGEKALHAGVNVVAVGPYALYYVSRPGEPWHQSLRQTQDGSDGLPTRDFDFGHERAG